MTSPKGPPSEICGLGRQTVEHPVIGDHAVVEHAGTAEALRAAATARFILNEALSHGVKVGAALDGSDLVMLAPRHMPRDVARWFENKLAEFREECIAVIQADVAARAGGQSS